jgi:hypothetical protein
MSAVRLQIDPDEFRSPGASDRSGNAAVAQSYDLGYNSVPGDRVLVFSTLTDAERQL